MAPKIQYATKELIPSFHKSLDIIARERIYIEMIEAKPLDELVKHHGGLIDNNEPIYYAVAGDEVVGMCDIGRIKNPRMNHRGYLATCILPEYRSQGLGSILLQKCIDHAWQIGIEKIELQVYTTNARAIGLYKKFGFVDEGITKHYRKLDGTYFDAISMSLFRK